MFFIGEKKFKNFMSLIIKAQKYVILERRGEWCASCAYVFRENVEKRDVSGRLYLFRQYVYPIMLELSSPSRTVEEICKSYYLGGAEWEYIVQLVAKYSPRGYEFYESNKKLISEEVANEIERVHEENLKFPSQKETAKQTSKNIKI